MWRWREQQQVGLQKTLLGFSHPILTLSGNLIQTLMPRSAWRIGQYCVFFFWWADNTIINNLRKKKKLKSRSVSCIFLSLQWNLVINIGFLFGKCINRNTGPEDVYVKVISCGICHSDIHQVKNDLGMSNYPMVPGYYTLLSLS